MKNRLQRFWKESSGNGIVSIPIGILIALILLLLAVSVTQYVILRSNIRTAANETLQIMKVENGADSGTRQRFDQLLKNMRIDPSKVTFEATPKTVQRGEVVEITATRDYHVFALKAIGVDYTATIKVHVSGLAHRYLREGEH
jgi:hypothetical protein